MHRLLPFAVLMAAASSAQAQTSNVSDMLATIGLRATEAELATRAAPTPSDLFALGGVRFLTTVETALQTRYRTGLSDDLTDLADIPVLRLPIAENPAPEAFDPIIIEQMFAQIVVDLGGALDALDRIGDTDDVGLVIDTADIWFDIDMSGTRGAGEDLFAVIGTDLARGLDGAAAPVIRFDTSDAAWLSAYAHLLSGVSELVLAFQPAQPVRAVLASIETMSGFGTASDPWGADAQFGGWVDLATMVLSAIEQQPLPDRTRAAQRHWLDMIADNRTFWARVARETDNEAEWIPNKNQTTALPLDFPADTGQRWLAVLNDADAVLRGTALVPHWRMQGDHGINLARLMTDPPEVDLIGMIQGGAFLPYTEQGRIIDDRSFQQFARMAGGNAGLLMIILN